MAKLEKKLNGDFLDVLYKVERGILDASISATLEDKSDFKSGSVRCSVRVFERYSVIGSNRVSLSVTLFQNESKEIWISAITSGGSQAVLFKMNTFGEEAFLNVLEDILFKL